MHVCCCHCHWYGVRVLASVIVCQWPLELTTVSVIILSALIGIVVILAIIIMDSVTCIALSCFGPSVLPVTAHNNDDGGNNDHNNGKNDKYDYSE